MRRVRVAGGCLLAAFAISAVGAATAAAEPPEVGRCVEVEGVKEGKKTIYSGGYGSARCIKPKAGHNGRYEWLPGPGPHNKFFGVGEETVLETVGGQRVFCSASVFKGEYTGAKTEKVKLSFDICEDSAKRPCQTTPAKEGEIIEQGTLEGNLAYIDSTKKTAGWDLKPEGGSGILFTYYCGKLPETIHTVEGSVIGQVKNGFFSNLNHMSKWGLVLYKAVKGKQLPEAFEGQANDTLTTNTTGIEMRSPEQTGMSTLNETIAGEGKDIEEEVNEEPVETKTK
ncbi:MAG TPA: hypothetical protein VMB05_02125 [Solirubrobacteraceae bacterium]|nr:hypothetical protein [Solirubrobacteraceae bacterium]